MRNVKAILIDAKNKEVKEVKFDGKYFSIHNFIGEEVECIDSVQMYTDDCIYYEFPQSECESEHFVSIGSDVYRGNVLITGMGDEDSWHESNWKAKNVKMPLQIIQDVVEFHNISEIEFKKDKELV
jgi:hypothetical protein